MYIRAAYELTLVLVSAAFDRNAVNHCSSQYLWQFIACLSVSIVVNLPILGVIFDSE